MCFILICKAVCFDQKDPGLYSKEGTEKARFLYFLPSPKFYQIRNARVRVFLFSFLAFSCFCLYFEVLVQLVQTIIYYFINQPLPCYDNLSILLRFAAKIVIAPCICIHASPYDCALPYPYTCFSSAFLASIL